MFGNQSEFELSAADERPLVVRPDELENLGRLRGEPAAGQSTWRQTDADGATVATVTLRRQGDRSEMVLADRRLRIELDQAAVAFPDLLCVELGPWGEACRKLVDGRLPWLPHRGNAELARVFEVEPLPISDADRLAGVERLRLRFRAAAERGTYIDTAWSRGQRLPRAWEAFIDSESTLRLVFDELAQLDGEPQWRKVALEDWTGKVLARWELVDVKAETGAIPEPAADWRDYVVIDDRAPEPAVDREFHLALEALGNYDWHLADQRLGAALKLHPGHPLLLFLRAWCHDQAEQAALAWGLRREEGRTAATNEQLEAVAQLLLRFKVAGPADRLLATALADQGLVSQRRFELLRRRAHCYTGLERWRWLAAAILALPAEPDTAQGDLRAQAIFALLAEFQHHQQAGALDTLAAEIDDADLNAKLLVREAELTDDDQRSAEIYWQVFEKGRLADDKLARASFRLNQVKQPERVIRIVEQGLRAGRTIEIDVRHQLRLAYQAVGRTLDARRASLADPGKR